VPRGDYGGLGWVVMALDLGWLLGGGGILVVVKVVCPWWLLLLLLLLLGEHVVCCSPGDAVLCGINTAIVVEGWSGEHFVEGSCASADLKLDGDGL